MKIQIFDVEHGFCALVTSDAGARMLVDCGHNSISGWRPSRYLQELGISYLEQLVITNYDEDHASDLAGIASTVIIGALATNPSVSGANLRHLKGIVRIGIGIETLSRMKDLSFGPAPADVALSFSMQFFWNNYPYEFDDENNLSLVTILRAHGLSICFPGDMEVAGWRNLVEKPGFISAMRSVNVFDASHHGRRNGCSEELFDRTGLSPDIVIISDSGIEFATQDTVAWYRAKSQGVLFGTTRRRVLTTRNDGRILIEATPQSTFIFPQFQRRAG